MQICDHSITMRKLTYIIIIIVLMDSAVGEHRGRCIGCSKGENFFIAILYTIMTISAKPSVFAYFP